MGIECSVDDFPHLVRAAVSTGQPITIFDLETNGFTHSAGFGIVEVGIIQIVPGMNGAVLRIFERTVNPGHPLDPEASKIHGKTEQMVRGQPEWGHFAAEVSTWLRHGMSCGYNSTWFDLPVLLQQNRRYGQGLLLPDCHIDVLSTLRTLLDGSPGSLDTACRNFGIEVRPDELHGALYDAYLCAKLLDRIVGDFGAEYVDAQKPAEIVRDQFEKLRQLLVVCARVWQTGYISEAVLARSTGITAFDASTVMVNALRFSLIDPSVVLDASPSADFVMAHLPTALREAQGQNRLKPIMESLLRAPGAPERLEYTVLQAGLMRELLSA